VSLDGHDKDRGLLVYSQLLLNYIQQDNNQGEKDLTVHVFAGLNGKLLFSALGNFLVVLVSMLLCKRLERLEVFTENYSQEKNGGPSRSCRRRATQPR